MIRLIWTTLCFALIFVAPCLAQPGSNVVTQATCPAGCVCVGGAKICLRTAPQPDADYHVSSDDFKQLQTILDRLEPNPAKSANPAARK
jgi:hypothetical protein